MPRYSRKIEEEPAPRSWMLTFTDLLTLLLGFFVLRLSMSSLGSPSIQETVQAFRQATDFKLLSPAEAPTAEIKGAEEGEKQGRADSGTGPTILSERLSQALQSITSKPGDKQGPMPLSQDVEVREEQAGTLISLGRSTFQSGSDELSFDARVRVQSIGGVLKEQLARGDRFEIRVEGHTDRTPINSARFPSNWELSTARATRVAEVLAESGVDPSLISAVGYASTRPLKVELIASEEANRRVEILIVPQRDAVE